MRSLHHERDLSPIRNELVIIQPTRTSKSRGKTFVTSTPMFGGYTTPVDEENGRVSVFLQGWTSPYSRPWKSQQGPMSGLGASVAAPLGREVCNLLLDGSCCHGNLPDIQVRL